MGLKLDVEPTIYVDSEVGIKISLEVSNIISQLQTKSGSIAYQIGTRTAQTVLRLKDGENQILAGLISNEERSTGNKIPGLGDIPIAGRLFGNQADDGSRTEIVLSITPRILRNIQRPDAATMEFDAGTESSLGGRVSSGGTSAQNSQTVASPQAASAPVLNAPIQGNLTSAPAVPDPNTTRQNSTNTSDVTAPAAASAQIKWQGPAQLKVGDVFAVQLVMQADQPVVSVPLAIGFDTKTLQITSVLEGEFLKQGGSQTSFASRVDPSGQILITGTRSGETGATSPGVFATINLKAIAASSTGSRLQLLTISPVVLGGKSINSPLPVPHVITISP